MSCLPLQSVRVRILHKYGIIWQEIAIRVQRLRPAHRVLAHGISGPHRAVAACFASLRPIASKTNHCQHSIQLYKFSCCSELSYASRADVCAACFGVSLYYPCRDRSTPTSLPGFQRILELSPVSRHGPSLFQVTQLPKRVVIQFEFYRRDTPHAGRRSGSLVAALAPRISSEYLLGRLEESPTASTISKIVSGSGMLRLSHTYSAANPLI
jgi:hypothetical protein